MRPLFQLSTSMQLTLAAGGILGGAGCNFGGVLGAWFVTEDVGELQEEGAEAKLYAETAFGFTDSE